MRFTLEISTDGTNDIHNVSSELKIRVRDLRGEGVIHLFVVGSTAALTTMEFESGLIRHDMAEVLQRLVPDNVHYAHEATWNDDNGHSHVRSALIGPSLTVPFADGKLLTGEYQQIVLMEFDTRPRRRSVICTVLQ
ncbi:MAG: secondary thiamine-phosphate synthase enzyme YjbQ [Planctomycetota bacterium]|nr:secondary thiamine-phosphate synthase enzyme YjbQ [Planctomycetota bacterium]